ncbi:MAG TPA: glycosyltransferase [Patescibacteria group bacterium]|nr:glycosyltransferase [Patescibacteria group bacterium]
MLVIASHIQYSSDGKPGHGTGEILASFMEQHKRLFMFIKHPLYFGSRSRIEYFDGKSQHVKILGFSRLPLVIRVFQDFIITYRSLRNTRTIPDYFIGVDPLNALYGILLRRLGLTKIVIFYTADYALQRFQNPITNSIYHAIDRTCLRYCDEVWNVSSRMVKLRKSQGVSENRNYFVPNIPLMRLHNLNTRKDNNSVILVSTLSKENIDFDATIRAMSFVTKKNSKMNLAIIGSGKDENELRADVKALGLDKYVHFAGAMLHKDVMKVISRSLVGLSIYKGASPWTWWGDSMKTREYLACGIPVIMTNACSTADDIRQKNVGFIVKPDPNDIAKKILLLNKNMKVLKVMRKNAKTFSDYSYIYRMLESKFL